MTQQITRRKISDTPPELSSLHPILARLYAGRGITQLSQLHRDLKHLLNYQQLSGLTEACEQLYQALEAQKRVLIVGDFDADGATSSALAVRVLKAFGFKHVDFLVPNRFTYGYGLTPEIVEVALQYQPDLIITVDNGIASIEGVNAANAHHIPVIVTDHHLPGEQLPHAAAIVNPNCEHDAFPSKHLAGVGVVFYLLAAFRNTLKQKNWFDQHSIPVPNLAHYLDIVALGTVADVVVLDTNNRILVHQGLQRIQAGHCCKGILALLNVANRDHKNITASDLGFALGPRLNAAGRLDDMSIGIKCLLSDDEDEAVALAIELDALNQQRRELEADMSQQAFKILDNMHLEQKKIAAGLCLYDPSWHQGVIGILASRIKDKTHRPVIALAKVSEDELKGSGRSVAGVHLRDALDAIATMHPGLLSKFGGHAMAAGLSLPLKNLATFERAFAEQITKMIDPQFLRGEHITDGELPADMLSLDLAQLLREAGPWGQGFAEPSFDGQFDIIEQRLVGAKHLKLILSPVGHTQQIDAIAFNIDPKQWPNHHARRITAVYKLDVNEFRGLQSPQLIIEALVPTC